MTILDNSDFSSDSDCFERCAMRDPGDLASLDAEAEFHRNFVMIDGFMTDSVED